MRHMNQGRRRNRETWIQKYSILFLLSSARLCFKGEITKIVGFRLVAVVLVLVFSFFVFLLFSRQQLSRYPAEMSFIYFFHSTYEHRTISRVRLPVITALYRRRHFLKLKPLTIRFWIHRNQILLASCLKIQDKQHYTIVYLYTVSLAIAKYRKKNFSPADFFHTYCLRALHIIWPIN